MSQLKIPQSLDCLIIRIKMRPSLFLVVLVFIFYRAAAVTSPPPLLPGGPPAIPPDGYAYFGACTMQNNDETDMGNLENVRKHQLDTSHKVTFRQLIGRRYAAHRLYLNANSWNNSKVPTARMIESVASGRVPMFSMYPSIPVSQHYTCLQL